VSSPTVPHRPPPSPVVPRRLPLFSDVFRCFRRPLPPPLSPPSPAVLCSYLPSPGGSCLRPWGSSSLLMTAVLGIQGRGRTTFCRPVSFGGLGCPPAGPYGGPGRLRTLGLFGEKGFFLGPGVEGGGLCIDGWVDGSKVKLSLAPGI